MSREAPKNHNDDDLLLLEEVAALSRMSVSTLRWMRHKNAGPPAFRLGRRLVFRRSAVQQWISQQEQAQS